MFISHNNNDLCKQSSNTKYQKHPIVLGYEFQDKFFEGKLHTLCVRVTGVDGSAQSLTFCNVVFTGTQLSEPCTELSPGYYNIYDCSTQQLMVWVFSNQTEDNHIL